MMSRRNFPISTWIPYQDTRVYNWYNQWQLDIFARIFLGGGILLLLFAYMMLEFHLHAGWIDVSSLLLIALLLLLFGTIVDTLVTNPGFWMILFFLVTGYGTWKLGWPPSAQFVFLGLAGISFIIWVVAWIHNHRPKYLQS